MCFVLVIERRGPWAFKKRVSTPFVGVGGNQVARKAKVGEIAPARPLDRYL